MSETPRSLESEEILRLLPHRPPLVLVDRVLEVVPHTRILALKNVSLGEGVLAGHFPGRPVMPGVLILEAMAQAGALLAVVSSEPGPDQQDMALLGVDRARFHRAVVPGDQLSLECTVAARRGALWRLRAKASVEGQLAAEAVILAVLGPEARDGLR